MKYTLFRTTNGVWYFFSFYQRQTLPCHPILKHILEKENMRQEIVKQLRGIGTITIDNHTFRKSEIEYYCKKYDYLYENHYFDDVDTNDVINAFINKHLIDKQLTNCNILCFELTEKCNLRCKYCVYGDNYSFHEDRIGSDMPFETAKTVIDYFFEIWRKDRNISYRHKYVGFYGGEPLLRMEQIKNIVSYFKEKASEINTSTGFLITTNGVLLDKHIDYLFDNQFSLLISLDGDEFADQYRVFPSGLPSFEVVSKNIELVRSIFPKYYHDNVSFSVVLHDKNEESAVRKHFDSVYNKTPIIAILRDSDTDTSNPYRYQPQAPPDYSDENLDMKYFLKTGDAQAFLKFINYYGRTIADNYGPYTFASLKDIPRHPTGVCLPFAKKCFITAQGKILPCERINFNYALGHVKNGKVFLNTTKIADLYNERFKQCDSICSKCFNFVNCDRCLFNDVLHKGNNYYCMSCMNKAKHSQYLSYIWSFFESNPQIYHQVKRKLSYEQ